MNLKPGHWPKIDMAKPKTTNKNNHWKTPDYLYDELNAEFDFNFDPCPLNHNLSKWNGLEVSWKERNFINSPYSAKEKTDFVEKALSESKNGKLCVLIVPVSTSTKLFHDIILPNKTEIRFVKGRVKFEGYGKNGNFIKGVGAMHDTMIVIFDGR